MAPEIAGMISTSQRLMESGRYEQAADLLEQARMKAADGKDTYTEAQILNRIGFVRQQEGKFIEARHAYDRSVIRLSDARGADSPELVPVLNSLANLLYESNQYLQADTLLHRNLKILAAAGPSDVRTGTELALLARVQLAERKPGPAEQSATDALGILNDNGHAEDVAAALGYSVMGVVYVQRHASDRAEESLKMALTILKKSVGPHDYRVGEATANLGFLYVNKGSLQAAEPLLNEAHATFQASSANTFFIRQFLERWADIEQKSGNKDKAKDLRQEAKALAGARADVSMSQYTVDANAFR